jgi:hypothetical protein
MIITVICPIDRTTVDKKYPTVVSKLVTEYPIPKGLCWVRF